jgi:aspartate racemase
MRSFPAKTERLPRHLGIVGCSPPGAALCYEVACTYSREAAPGLEISLHSHAFGDYMERIEADDWEGVAELMLSSARKLAESGAQLLVAPCNTIHAAFDRVLPRSPLPWLHIADEVAAAARRRGFARIALLGTRSIMEGPIFADRLAAAGIAQLIPEAEERHRIDQLIFDELVRGIVSPGAGRYLRGVIERMRGAGCDAVGLCCTELPLAIPESGSPLPVLDSTRLLAVAAVEKCGTAPQ